MFYKTKGGRILELDQSIVGDKLPATIGEYIEEDNVYQGVEIIQKSDYVEELFNRYIVVSTGGGKRRMYTIFTKYNFGKLSRLELLKDLGMGKKEVYGAIWVYDQNNVPSLRTVAVLKPDGRWKLL